MRDGPPGDYAPKARLLSLLGHKRGWPTLSPSAEDKLCITPPTIMGVSGHYLFHASQSPLNNGFEWILHVYQLRSFRMAPKSRLPYYQHNVPFEIRKVAIDASQELMVLAQLFFPPQQWVIRVVFLFLLIDFCSTGIPLSQLCYTFVILTYAKTTRELPNRD